MRALPLYTTPKPAPEVVPSVEVTTQPAPEAEATAPNSGESSEVAAETTVAPTAEPIAEQTAETPAVQTAETPETPAATTPEEKKTPTPESQPAVEESRPRRRRSAAN